MKSLSVAKPLIIIMIGLPAAGKSLFAEQFSETFGAPLVRYDRLRYELFSEPTYSKDEEDIIARIANYQLQEIIKSKHTCLLDGGGQTHTERIALRKIARSAGYEVLLLWVQTDPATSQQRATHRSTRRKGDQYNPKLSAEQYAKQAKRLSAPRADEQYIVISGKHTYATQLKAVLTKLSSPHKIAADKQPIPSRTVAVATERPKPRAILIR